MANTEAFECDECGDGVILWDGHREEIVEGWVDFRTILDMNSDIEVLPGGFCSYCHLLVN
jgi:hypothetical protein